MEIKRLHGDFTVCRTADFSQVRFDAEYCFTGKTDKENSLICQTKDVPENIVERVDGWRGFRIEGVLDFSLIGVLAKISALLAEEEIGILAVSTYNTDYIFVKKEQEEKALSSLGRAGYKIIGM